MKKYINFLLSAKYQYSIKYYIDKLFEYYATKIVMNNIRIRYFRTLKKDNMFLFLIKYINFACLYSYLFFNSVMDYIIEHNRNNNLGKLLKHPYIDINKTTPILRLYGQIMYANLPPNENIKFLKYIEMLLNHKNININAKDFKGHDLFTYAVECEHNDIINILLNNPNLDLDYSKYPNNKLIKKFKIFKKLETKIKL